MRSAIPHPRIVIVGAGFAGLRAARLLSHFHVDVVILDYNNYHTFLPLLYQVAAAELEPENIVYPVRSTLRGRQHLRLFLGPMTALDVEKKLVTSGEHVFPYDYLILSMGSEPNFYGVEGAAEHTFQLKNLEHAIGIRNHILTRFEHALYEPDLEKRLKILTFAVVGGGPTGIEFTGAFAELIRGPLRKDYPRLNIKEVRLVLLEATDHLLPGLPEKLQVYTERRLQKMGVEVWLRSPVSRIMPDSLELKDGRVLPLETAIWTAGVRGASPPLLDHLPIAPNGQVRVQPTLQMEGHPEIYVCGDLARFEENGRPLPMVAPLAVQEGEMAARNILRQIKKQELQPFRYNDLGTLVTIGRNAAAVHLLGRDFTGFIAWILWVGVHIFKLIGFRNRLLVLVNWAWDYLFFERGVRLIVPLSEES